MSPLMVVAAPAGAGILDAIVLAAPEPELEHALTNNAAAPMTAVADTRTDDRVDRICTNLSG